MIQHVIIPPGASIDEIVEAAIKLFTSDEEKEGGVMADGEPGKAMKVLVYGVNRIRVGDLIVEVDSFPDEIGPVMSEAPQYKHGKVKSNTLNMRKGPGTNYIVLRVLPKGTEFVILEELTASGNNPWLRIDLEGLEGFVYAPLVDVA